MNKNSLYKFIRLGSIALCGAFLLMSASVASNAAATKASTTRKIKVEKPNFTKIANETRDPKSEMYFPKLMKIYNRNDTSMTHEQYRNLYLGYLFQEDYDPYRTSPYNITADSILTIANVDKQRLVSATDSLNKLIKANKISSHEAEKQKDRFSTTYKRRLRELATAAELALKDNPFDLREMSILVHASQEMGNAMKAKIWEYRLENILGAIKSTGNGDSMDNAFYVIYPMHEYNMIQLLGYEPTAVDFPADGYDYISVRPDKDSKRASNRSAKGFYFNVGPLTEQYELKHPEAMEESNVDSGDDAPVINGNYTTIVNPDDEEAE